MMCHRSGWQDFHSGFKLLVTGSHVCPKSLFSDFSLSFSPLGFLRTCYESSSEAINTLVTCFPGLCPACQNLYCGFWCKVPRPFRGSQLHLAGTPLSPYPLIKGLRERVLNEGGEGFDK